ncbi:MAG: hypothetical protein VR73_01470 [Gammaproteobacteria bacterium BRH_c0]|nr:MAG: hypothetical protein VR73_01470 [Gammaproteobacteria bacterium BRH_c0]
MTQASIKTVEAKTAARTKKTATGKTAVNDSTGSLKTLVNSEAASAKDVVKKTRSTGSEQSITRILDAAMESASRQGLRNLSMSDVCRIAGVARGTLYRYFPSKDALLESLGQRTRYQTETGIRNAAASAETGNDCLREVVSFLIRITSETKAREILEVEPVFFMEFLRRNMPHYRELMADVLEPFFNEIDEALGQKIDRVLLSEMILRLQISYIFLPDEQTSDVVMERIFSAIDEIK